MSSLDEFFSTMMENFRPEQAEGVTMTVQFNLAGGGQYYVNIYDGAAEAERGRADDPFMTVSMTADDFRSMIDGQLNPMQGYMSGRIKADNAAFTKVMSMFGLA